MHTYLFALLEINSAPHEGLKSRIQDIKHAQEPRASVHKRVIHTVVDRFESMTF